MRNFLIAYRLFQSTLPVWGATFCCRYCFERWSISIHAPRVGSDFSIFGDCDCLPNFNPRSPCGERPRGPVPTHKRLDFNPRSPCGERPNSAKFNARHCRFQSTLPVWGATGNINCTNSHKSISIHAPRVGSDLEQICRFVR